MIREISKNYSTHKSRTVRNRLYLILWSIMLRKDLTKQCPIHDPAHEMGKKLCSHLVIVE